MLAGVWNLSIKELQLLETFFEIDEFCKGTYAIADCIAGADCWSIVGGGDSVSALKKSGNQDKVSFVSTAGGAFMELMEGKTLPGIAALDK